MITDLEARQVATAWHGGQSSKLYALSSTGTIHPEGMTDEIVEAQNHAKAYGGSEGVYSSNPVGELHELLTYCRDKGTRGPQEGWSELSW